MNYKITQRPLVMLTSIFYVTTLFVVFTESVEPIQPKCNYEDTVDITEHERLPDGSLLYKGIVIPKNLTDFYDYEEIYEAETVPVPRHLRGCICLLTACVKFCCHPKATKVKGARDCSRELEDEIDYSPYINITDSKNDTYGKHVHNEFFMQQHLPCEIGYTVKDEWSMSENGELLLDNGQHTIPKKEYCITPEKANDTYTLRPLICLLPPPPPPKNLIVNFIVMALSLPLMIATILVYAFIRELRNLHGKCLIAYLTSMTCGDILLNTNTLLGVLEVYVPDGWCKIVGYSAYFCIISAFSWLSIISFDLWYNFRGTNTRISRALQQQRFFIYSLFGWSLSAICTAMTFGAQLSNLNPNLKPQIGIAACWLNVKEWSALIYLYGPMMLIIFFNSTMFILTFCKIYKVQKELSRFAGKEERNKHFRCEKDDFGMFLRLFVIMGVTWVFEVLSYFAGSDSEFFYVTDFLNSALGIIIFVLFVLKRRVRMLIRKRLCHKDKTAYESEDSSPSDCEPEELCMRNYNKDGTLQFLK